MEKELADLSLDEEEDEGMQFAAEARPQRSLYELCLVGCYLVASVVHFLVMKNTMANLWHLLGGIQISNLDRFCQKRINLGLKEVGCGWDVSLRAQLRRASVTPSIWLKEDNMGRNYGKEAGKQEVGNNGKGMSSFDTRHNLGFINHTLGFNLEGRGR
ncbi:hypothetical protein Gotur_007314 [Gossypium turneri]